MTTLRRSGEARRSCPSTRRGNRSNPTSTKVLIDDSGVVYIPAVEFTYQGMRMNRSTIRPFSFVVLLLLAACSSNQSGSSSARRPATSGVVITADDIARSPGMSLEQIMIARIPGLTFGRAEDGRVILRLRGTT